MRCAFLLLANAGLIAGLLLTAASAWANSQLSVFGTLGAAVSDQDFVYQRHLTDDATVIHDSLLGLQLDTALSQQVQLTVQTKFAASTHDDNAWEPSLSWAFLSWRPENDVLVRVGKLRLPLMLYSANSDVGTTFPLARMPQELYSLLPSTDVKGLAVSKTWLHANREWTLESYLGKTRSDWRYFMREELLPEFTTGTLYIGTEMILAGLVLETSSEDTTWRLGFHHAEVESDYGALPSDFPFVSIAPGIGYFKVFEALPGPPVPTVEKLLVDVLTVGFDLALPHDWRVLGEYGRRRISNAIIGPDTSAGYLALLKTSGRWTPYVYWAGIRSHKDALGLYQKVNHNRVPEFIPDAALLNATQRLEADLQGAVDQYSVAFGATYRLSPTRQLKAEWSHTRSGATSYMIDAPLAEENGGRQINVFSLLYHFTF